MSLQAQETSTGNGFVIDSNLPFVYVAFDHIGLGTPRNGQKSIARIWLHLKNNCRIPIVFRVNGPPLDSPSDDASVMYEVVPTPPPMIQENVVAVPDEPGSKATTDEMPYGTSSDVGSTWTIEPGKEMNFSIPINDISKRWHIEIPFDFVLPKGASPRNPKNSLGPTLQISYSIWDVPPDERTKIEKN
jgi:hypothetical protein